MLLPSQNGMTALEVWAMVLLSTIVVGIVAARSLLIKNRLLSRPWIVSLGLLAGVWSAVSVGVAARVTSGTGWHTAFGYPRTFYFIWESFENNQRLTSFSLWRFLENSLVYGAVLCLIVVFYHGLLLGSKRIRDL